MIDIEIDDSEVRAATKAVDQKPPLLLIEACIPYFGHPNHTRGCQMDTLLRLPKVKKITGLGRSTIYRMMKAGEFPRPVAISRGAVGWRQSDIERWIESRQLATEKPRR